MDYPPAVMFIFISPLFRGNRITTCLVLVRRKIEVRIAIKESDRHQFEPCPHAWLDRVVFEPRDMVQAEDAVAEEAARTKHTKQRRQQRHRVIKKRKGLVAEPEGGAEATPAASSSSTQPAAAPRSPSGQPAAAPIPAESSEDLD